MQHEDTEINLTGYHPGVSADGVAGKMNMCLDEVSEYTKDSETVLVNLDHMVKTDRNAQVTAWSCIGDNGKPYSGFTYKLNHPILKNARTNTHLAAIFTANKTPGSLIPQSPLVCGNAPPLRCPVLCVAARAGR